METDHPPPAGCIWFGRHDTLQQVDKMWTLTACCISKLRRLGSRAAELLSDRQTTERLSDRHARPTTSVWQNHEHESVIESSLTLLSKAVSGRVRASMRSSTACRSRRSGAGFGRSTSRPSICTDDEGQSQRYMSFGRIWSVAACQLRALWGLLCRSRLGDSCWEWCCPIPDAAHARLLIAVLVAIDGVMWSADWTQWYKADPIRN